MVIKWFIRSDPCICFVMHDLHLLTIICFSLITVIFFTMTFLSKGLNFENWLFPSCHVPFFVMHVNCYSSLMFHLTQTKPFSKECTKWHFSAFRCHFHIVDILQFGSQATEYLVLVLCFMNTMVDYILINYHAAIRDILNILHGNWIRLEETIPANNCP